MFVVPCCGGYRKLTCNFVGSSFLPFGHCPSKSLLGSPLVSALGHLHSSSLWCSFKPHSSQVCLHQSPLNFTLNMTISLGLPPSCFIPLVSVAWLVKATPSRSRVLSWKSCLFCTPTGLASQASLCSNLLALLFGWRTECVMAPQPHQEAGQQVLF
jgi:hypothetical protein